VTFILAKVSFAIAPRVKRSSRGEAASFDMADG
jgi:hypothetical protein